MPLFDLRVSIRPAEIAYTCHPADFDSALQSVLDAHTEFSLGEWPTFSLASCADVLEAREQDRCEGYTTDYSADIAATDEARIMARLFGGRHIGSARMLVLGQAYGESTIVTKI